MTVMSCDWKINVNFISFDRIIIIINYSFRNDYNLNMFSSLFRKMFFIVFCLWNNKWCKLFPILWNDSDQCLIYVSVEMKNEIASQSTDFHNVINLWWVEHFDDNQQDWPPEADFHRTETFDHSLCFHLLLLTGIQNHSLDIS